ncbi:hypothetical protein ABPG72_010852 [Tetrahymena utriculariae]
MLQLKETEHRIEDFIELSQKKRDSTKQRNILQLKEKDSHHTYLFDQLINLQLSSDTNKVMLLYETICIIHILISQEYLKGSQRTLVTLTVTIKQARTSKEQLLLYLDIFYKVFNQVKQLGSVKYSFSQKRKNALQLYYSMQNQFVLPIQIEDIAVQLKLVVNKEQE